MIEITNEQGENIIFIEKGKITSIKTLEEYLLDESENYHKYNEESLSNQKLV